MSENPDYKVVRKSHWIQEHGYIDKTEVVCQYLLKRVPALFGLFTGWEVVDQEEVPYHIVLQASVFGDTFGWKSKFAEYI